MIIYTSGSTGFPKGVMMTHANIDAAAAVRSPPTWRTPADDIILNVLPISFDYGLYQVLMAMRLGATLVLGEVLRLPAGGLRSHAARARHRLPARADDGGADPADARPRRRAASPTSATSPTPPRRCRRRISRGCRSSSPACGSIRCTGMTECKRCTYLPPAELDATRRARSASRFRTPRPTSSTTSGARVAPGVTGELVIRGPHVMQGYWRDEAATATRAEARPAAHARRCSTPATSSAPTPTASSISSAARTTSSSRAARR